MASAVLFALSEAKPPKNQKELERRAAQYLRREYKKRGWRTALSHVVHSIMDAVEARVL